MKKVKSNLSILFSLGMLLLSLGSCSNNDYVSAIPQESTALLSMDVSKMGGDGQAMLLKSVLQLTDMDESGIDLSAKLYLFEASDGNLGLCAKVADQGELHSLITKLASNGIASKIEEHRGYQFCILRSSWVLAFSDEAMLLMGPVEGNGQAELKNRMANYLEQSEEEGIKGNKIYAKLDSIEAPMALVAEAQALPEKFVSPFTLGAPQGADASQVLIMAGMELKDDCLMIDGKSFSFNKKVDKGLKEASEKVYRPIRGSYVKSMSKDALMGFFVNVKGTDFIELLRADNGIQALLAGVNTAIDMDNIIKSIDGDMSIVSADYTDSGLKISMSADLANTHWLADVNYWKQSVPKGSQIKDWQKNAYCYTDGKTSFYFGVSKDGKQFFSGSNPNEAMASITPANHPLPEAIQQAIVGQKMVLLVNLSAVKDEKISSIMSVFKPVFGNVNTILYRLK